MERHQLQRTAAGRFAHRSLEPPASSGNGEEYPTFWVGASRASEGPIVAASDYMKMVPDQLAPWLAGRMVSLGTDGFGRSDNRKHLREHFEINAASIASAALSKLAQEGKFDAKKATKAIADLGINPEKIDPATA